MLSHFSHVPLCATPWTEARQAPLSMGFSRKEHWSGLPFPSPGDLPDSGIEAASLTSNLHWQAGSLPLAPLACKHCTQRLVAKRPHERPWFLRLAPGRTLHPQQRPPDHRPSPQVGAHPMLQGAHLRGHGLGLPLKCPERKGQP